MADVDDLIIISVDILSANLFYCQLCLQFIIKDMEHALKFVAISLVSYK